MRGDLQLGDLAERIKQSGAEVNVETFVRAAVERALVGPKAAGVGLSSVDTTLPLFVYGNFKRGELGHDLIEEWVEEGDWEEVDGQGGILWEMDGMPMLTRTAGGKVQGHRLRFKSPEAYDVVASFEPATHYEWATIAVGEEAEQANVLVALKALTPAVDGRNCLHEPWTTARDPLFKYGLPTVADGIRADALTPLVLRGGGGDWARYYRVQSVYMLACSVLERIALRTIEGKAQRPTTAVARLGKTDAFTEAVREVGMLNKGRKVSRADHPRPKNAARLKEPEDFAAWAYQIRSNMVHQGKSASHEAELIRTALIDLHDVLRVYLLHRIPDLAHVWATTDPSGAAHDWRTKLIAVGLRVATVED